MLQKTWQALMSAELHSFASLGAINYFSITNEAGRLRLVVHTSDGEEPVVYIAHQGQCRQMLRLVMDLVETKQVAIKSYGDGPVSYVLVDPVRLSVQLWRSPSWTNPRDPYDPHQLWLREGDNDRKVRQEAFMAACAYLLPGEFKELYGLHDSAQYHFITMMINPDADTGEYRSVKTALQEARCEHKAMTK